MSPPNIDKAVVWINTCQQESSSIARALRIGDYVIDHFYCDLDEVRSKAPRKPASLRVLHKRLSTGRKPVSAVTLGNYIRVAAQERSLDIEEHCRAFDRLSFSQRLVLTQIEDIELKIILAQRAISESLTCKQLKLLVAEANGASAHPALEGTALRNLQRDMRKLAAKLSRAGRLPRRAAAERHLRAEVLATSAHLQEQLEDLVRMLESEDSRNATDMSIENTAFSASQDSSDNCKDIFTARVGSSPSQPSSQATPTQGVP